MQWQHGDGGGGIIPKYMGKGTIAMALLAIGDEHTETPLLKIDRYYIKIDTFL